MEIGEDEEFSRDWDWYAADPDEHVGHFTTAGMRPLPRSVKRDRSAAERVALYFLEYTAKSCGYSVRRDSEADAGGWKNEVARDRYLQSFTKMAARGMFSYNTQLVYGSDAKYYLVATPECPLHLADLPPDIREIVAMTRASVSFESTEYISEQETLSW